MDDEAVGEVASALWWNDSSPWGTSAFDVCFDPALSWAERETIRRSVTASWASYGHVRFRGWQTCPAGPLPPTAIWIHPGFAWRATTGPTAAGYGSATTEFGLAQHYTNCVNNQLGPDACNYFLAMHEIGHVLGYPHEHERPETPGSCAAIGETGHAVTDYDPNSVMNYCAADFVLSHLDVEGHVAVYGPGKRSADRWPIQRMRVAGSEALMTHVPGKPPERWGWTTSTSPAQPKRMGSISTLPPNGRVVVAPSGKPDHDLLIAIERPGPLAELSFIDPATTNRLGPPLSIAGSEHGVEVVPLRRSAGETDLLVTTRAGTSLYNVNGAALRLIATMPEWKLREVQFVVGNFKGSAESDEVIVTSGAGSTWWELGTSDPLEQFFDRPDLVLGDVELTAARLKGSIEQDIIVQTAFGSEVLAGAQPSQSSPLGVAVPLGVVELRRFSRGPTAVDGVVFLRDTEIQVWVPSGASGSLSHEYSIVAGWSDSLVTIADVDGDQRDDILVSDRTGTSIYLHGEKVSSAALPPKFDPR